MMATRVASVGLLAFFVALANAGPVFSLQESNHVNVDCGSKVRSTYVLGPDDELEISGPELDETAKPTRIDGDGSVNVPLIGRVQVAGLTIQQCEQELNKRLSTYIRQPQVVVNIKELRSQPVSVLGAVNTPGVYQVRGHKTLLEMLSLAGGIRTDAGYSIRITRQLEWGCIPLPHTTADAAGGFSVGEVNLKEILGAENPEENIQIFPHDVISIPKAEMVYVVGEVKRAGGFALAEKKSISALQALSLAEGLSGTADTRHARILRVQPNADQRAAIMVDLKGILSGKRADVPLQGDDILFIPSSAAKNAAHRATDVALQGITGLLIWRVP